MLNLLLPYRKLYRTIIIVVSVLIFACPGFAKNPDPRKPVSDQVFGYEWDKNEFRPINDEGIIKALSSMNEALSASGNKKVYFVTAYMGEIGAFPLVKDNETEPGEFAVAFKPRKLDEEEISIRFRLLGGRFRDLIPPTELGNCAIYALGYYTAKYDRSASTRKSIHFLHELLISGSDLQTRDTYLHDLTQFRYIPLSGQTGLHKMQERRITHLGNLLLGKVQPARQLSLDYKLNEAAINSPGGWLEQLRSNMDASRQLPVVEDLNNRSLLVASYTSALTENQCKALAGKLSDLEQELTGENAGMKARIIVTDFATSSSAIDQVEQFIVNLSQQQRMIGVWIHINLQGIAIKFFNSANDMASGILCREQVESNMPRWLSAMKDAQDVVTVWPVMLKISTWLAGKGELPEHFIDPDNPQYDPVLANAWALISSTYRLLDGKLTELDWSQAANIANTIGQATSTGSAQKALAKHTPTQIEFAFLAGIWNSARGTLLASADLSGLARELFCSPEKRKQFARSWQSFRQKAIESGGYSNVLWQMVKDRYQKANASMLSYYMGGHLVDLFTLYISLLKTGKLAQLAKLLDAIDPANYFITPIIKVADFALKTSKGLVRLGGNAVGMLLRISGEPGHRILEVMDRITGQFIDLMKHWELLERVQLVADNGMIVTLWYSPKLKKSYEKIKNQLFTFIDGFGNKHKIIDAQVIEPAGQHPAIGTVPEGLVAEPDGEAAVIRQVAGESSEDGTKLFTVESPDGQAQEVVAGTGGSNDHGSGGNSGNGSNDDGNGGRGPRKMRKAVSIRDEHELGGVGLGKERKKEFLLYADGKQIGGLVRKKEGKGPDISYYFYRAESPDDLQHMGIVTMEGHSPSVGATSPSPGKFFITGPVELPEAIRTEFQGIEAIAYEDALRLYNNPDVEGILALLHKDNALYPDADGYSEELKKFLDALAEKKSPEEAALGTTIGELARKEGFQYPEVIEDEAGDIFIIFRREKKAGASAPTPSLRKKVVVEDEGLLGKPGDVQSGFKEIRLISGNRIVGKLIRKNHTVKGEFLYHFSRLGSTEKPQYLGKMQLKANTPDAKVNYRGYPPSDGKYYLAGDLVIPKNLNDEFAGLGEIVFMDSYILHESDIEGIFGVWPVDPVAYKDYGGQSINLTRYQEARRAGKIEGLAAFDTPNGKWARKIKFNKCYVLDESEHGVIVLFKRTFQSAGSETASKSFLVSLHEKSKQVIGSLAGHSELFAKAENGKVFMVKKGLTENSSYLVNYEICLEDGTFFLKANSYKIGVGLLEVRGGKGIMHLDINMPKELKGFQGFEEELILKDALATCDNLLKPKGLTVEAISVHWEKSAQNSDLYTLLKNASLPEAAIAGTPLGKWAGANEFKHLVIVGIQNGGQIAERGNVFFFKNEPPPALIRELMIGSIVQPPAANQMYFGELNRQLLISTRPKVVFSIYKNGKFEMEVSRQYVQEVKKVTYEMNNPALFHEAEKFYLNGNRPVAILHTHEFEPSVIEAGKNMLYIDLNLSVNITNQFGGLRQLLLEDIYRLISTYHGRIDAIRVRWHHPQEADFVVFSEARKLLSKEDALKQTELWKWAEQNNFKQCKFLKESESEVDVVISSTAGAQGESNPFARQVIAFDVLRTGKVKVLNSVDGENGLKTWDIGDLSGTRMGAIARKQGPVQWSQDEFGKLLEKLGMRSRIVKSWEYSFTRVDSHTPDIDFGYTIREFTDAQGKKKRLLCGFVDKGKGDDINTIPAIIQEYAKEEAAAYGYDAVATIWGSINMNPHGEASSRIFLDEMSKRTNQSANELLPEIAAARATATADFWSRMHLDGIEVRQLSNYPPIYIVIFRKAAGQLPE